MINNLSYLSFLNNKLFITDDELAYKYGLNKLLMIDQQEFNTYKEDTFIFKDIKYRTTYNEQIVFYYEGSEADFNKLDADTKAEITNNALDIVYNYDYHPRYGRN